MSLAQLKNLAVWLDEECPKNADECRAASDSLGFKTDSSQFFDLVMNNTEAMQQQQVNFENSPVLKALERLFRAFPNADRGILGYMLGTGVCQALMASNLKVDLPSEADDLPRWPCSCGAFVHLSEGQCPACGKQCLPPIQRPPATSSAHPTSSTPSEAPESPRAPRRPKATSN